MNDLTISTKELREELPRIRAGLARGNRYTIIFRSRPIGRLEPLTTNKTVRREFRGGGLRLQAHNKHKLTPEYLNKLAESKYDG